MSTFRRLEILDDILCGRLLVFVWSFRSRDDGDLERVSLVSYCIQAIEFRLVLPILISGTNRRASCKVVAFFSICMDDDFVSWDQFFPSKLLDIEFSILVEKVNYCPLWTIREFFEHDFALFHLIHFLEYCESGP